MIDDILTNDNNMKFSGGNENFGVEESKEGRDMDIEMEEEKSQKENEEIKN